MRTTPAGLRLPKMPVSLETSLAGQLGFQLAASFLMEAVPSVSGEAFMRSATTRASLSVATSALVYVAVKPSMAWTTTL